MLRPPQIAQLEEVRQEVGFNVQEFVAGLHSLADADPPYIELETASGWSEQRAGGGYVSGISERAARRELGARPSADSLLEQLVVALTQAADEEDEPERKGRLQSAAAVLGRGHGARHSHWRDHRPDWKYRMSLRGYLFPSV